jgi:tetratricopeptide (TPR) repeat protein
MNEGHDPNRTVDVPSRPVGNEPPDAVHTVAHSSAPSDSLHAGLAAGFGPRSSLAEMRPVLLKEAEGESGHVVKPSSDAMPPPEQTGNRYQLQGEIARGGMGAVLRGHDVDLGRNLAVKVLLQKHAERPEVVRRFLEEAQIGGQLQHPGVVPVYDIGRFGERPFFTMKLVKGKTLASLLGERAEAAQDRPRFLAVVLQVAQALAYAHAKGVIHRDLKPANIMVGAFGEVQVMDWGLAKVLPEGGIADEERASRAHQPEEGTLIRTARSSGSAGSFGTDTEAGSLLGTPAYMPPEQANGDVGLVDRRADVFGLGAILCEILTGKPPYVGRSSEEVRRKACNGAQTDALERLDACGADQELIALTKACLSPEAMDRPKDAQAVAERLTAYLDGVQERLQAAQRERAVALAREAEQRKRRKVQLALAAAVVALLLGGGAFAFWRNAQAQVVRQREVRNAEAVAALLSHAEEALKAGDAAKAQVALEAAKNRSHEGGAEEHAERLGQLDADLALLRELDAIDQFSWTWAENRFPDPAAVATRTRGALKRFGADPEAVSVEDAAARVSASVVRERIVSALDRLLRQEKTARVRALLRLVDAEPYRDAVRDVVLANDRAKLLELAGKDQALEQPSGFSAFLGESPAIRVERRRQLLQAAVSRRPGNLGLLMTLGNSYPNQKESADDRKRWFQAAVAAAPANAAAHTNLGVALANKGKEDEAIACYRKAVALDPKLAVAHSNLGAALADKGKVDEAIACYRKAIALDPKLAMAHTNLGAALHGKGQEDEALACFHKAIALDSKFAMAHNNLGLALHHKGKEDEAIACYQKAIALDPKNAGAHDNLGEILCDVKHDYDGAIACFRQALALDPKYAKAHCNMGVALSGKGKKDEAIECYKKAIDLDPKLANAHRWLGAALADKGKVDEAIECYQKAIALYPKFAIAHNNLGLALKGKGRMNEAIECYKKAIAFDPKLAGAHDNLGTILCDVRHDYDGAIACFRQALALDPKYAKAHCNLGVALSGKGKKDEAIECYKKAIDLDPKLANAHRCLGGALADKGKVDEAIACFKQALSLDPKFAMAHANLGAALEAKGKADEAIACYRKAIALDPKNTQAHNNLGLTLHHKGRLDEAIACYRKAIALEPKLAEAHYNLGNALKDKGQVVEAIACYRKTIALDSKHAEAHCNLGLILGRQGHFAESLAALKRGHELGSKRPGWPYPSADWVRQAERLAALEAKLPAFLAGKFQASDTAERLGLIGVCQAKKLHAAAARLSAGAFAAEPTLADDLQASHRYNAACSAALAAAGQGEDAGKLDDKERARLRKQALDWLKADLAVSTKRLQSGSRIARRLVTQQMQHWQKDTDLAGIRDKVAVAKLPAEEQKACTQLWADVAELLKKAQEPPK